VLVTNWRHHYNRVEPRSALSYRPPALEAALLLLPGLLAALLEPLNALTFKPDYSRRVRVSLGMLEWFELLLVLGNRD